MAQIAQNKKKFSVYDYDAKIQCTFQLIEKELSIETIQLIKNYANVMTAQSMAKATIHKHVQTILNLSRYVGKSWNDVTKQDIDALVAKIVQTYSDNGQETNTTHDHKKILKIFFRWFKLGSRSKDEVGDPPETKHIKIKRVKDKIIREDLITEEDRIKLLQACGENARDRAFIDCHLEAGTRPGEILNLQISHVKFDKFGAVLHVDGKTGARTIRLIRSTPSLATWLSIHPFKENPNSPLWISTRRNYFGEHLSYSSARLMVKRRCKQANLPKRLHLNLFRHSEATETAKFMTEAQMKKRHGWTADSKMPARYVHLVNADVDDAIFEHHGIKTTEEKTQDLPKRCAVCDSINASNSSKCFRCGKTLDIKTAIEEEEKERKEAEKKEDELNQIRSELEETRKLVEILMNSRKKE